MAVINLCNKSCSIDLPEHFQNHVTYYSDTIWFWLNIMYSKNNYSSYTTYLCVHTTDRRHKLRNTEMHEE